MDEQAAQWPRSGTVDPNDWPVISHATCECGASGAVGDSWESRSGHSPLCARCLVEQVDARSPMHFGLFAGAPVDCQCECGCSAQGVDLEIDLRYTHRARVVDWDRLLRWRCSRCAAHWASGAAPTA